MVVESVPVVGLSHVDLFSGIGGFSLAARWVGGFDTIAFCEIDEYARRVLKRNFPGIPIFEDVAELHPVDLIPRDGRVDVVTAGFPCQDLSIAGARRGIEADRSGLFFEITRLSDEVYAYCGARPILVLENVPGLLSGDGGAWARRVYGELAGRGYHCEWKVVSAADVGAPHLRRRWWCVCYVADTGGFGHRGRNRTERGAGERIFQQEEQGRHPLGGEAQGRSEPCGAGTAQLGLGGMADGIPSWLDEPGDIPRVASGQKDRVARLKGLGNAVVPQVAMIPLLRAKEILTGEHYEAGKC